MSLNSYMVLYTGCFLLHSHKKELIDLVYCPVSAACMCTVQPALASLTLYCWGGGGGRNNLTPPHVVFFSKLKKYWSEAVEIFWLFLNTQL